MFKETKSCEAMFYLDDSGYEITREAFLSELFCVANSYGQHGYMLYVGPGYVPLRVAVISWNESQAVESFEDWCRRTDRQEEINQADEEDAYWCEYELLIEVIPVPEITSWGKRSTT